MCSRSEREILVPDRYQKTMTRYVGENFNFYLITIPFLKFRSTVPLLKNPYVPLEKNARRNDFKNYVQNIESLMIKSLVQSAI